MVSRLSHLESLFVQMRESNVDAAKALLEEENSKALASKNRVEQSIVKKPVKKALKRCGRVVCQPDYIARMKAQKEWKKKQQDSADSDSLYGGGPRKKKSKVTKNNGSAKRSARIAASPAKKSMKDDDDFISDDDSKTMSMTSDGSIGKTTTTKSPVVEQTKKKQTKPPAINPPNKTIKKGNVSNLDAAAVCDMNETNFTNVSYIHRQTRKIRTEKRQPQMTKPKKKYYMRWHQIQL